MMTAPAPTLHAFLQAISAKALAAGVFESVVAAPDRLVCEAKGSAAPAQYRVEVDGDKFWVSLVTADRWLSGSIELDLIHTGDKLDELIDEELVELGYTGPSLGFQHFRSDEKLFTFRSCTNIAVSAASDPASVDAVLTCLLAYEACFRNLGDMQAGDDE